MNRSASPLESGTTDAGLGGTQFEQRMNGTFRGILHWAQLDALWAVVRAEPTGWYVTTTGEPIPAAPTSEAALLRFIDEIDVLLREEHAHDYCGVVYVDDPAQPSLIKILDPHQLGSACSGSTTPTPPRWILSRLAPTAIDDPAPPPNARRRWWQRVFG